MNINKSWEVFKALQAEFEKAAPQGATPHDFHNFIHYAKNGLPFGEDTVLRVLAHDGVETHTSVLVDLAKEEISSILQ